MGYAFISYSSKNQDVADAVCSLLNRNGIKTWMAPGNIPVGSQYAQVINRAIKECACFVLLLSNHSQNSLWVSKEVERAVTYQQPILPIKLEELTLNDEFELYIGSSQGIAIHQIDESLPEIRTMLDVIRAHTNGKKSNDTSQQPERFAFELGGSLLRRAFLFVEDGDWNKAAEYADRALDIEPENGEAYLVKAMAELEISSRSSLGKAQGLADNANVQKALRFGSDELKHEINACLGAARSDDAADSTAGESENRSKLQKEAERVVAAAKLTATSLRKKALLKQIWYSVFAILFVVFLFIISEGELAVAFPSLIFVVLIGFATSFISRKDPYRRVINDISATIFIVPITIVRAVQLFAEDFDLQSLNGVLNWVYVLIDVVLLVLLIKTIRSRFRSVRYKNASRQIQAGRFVEAYEIMLDLNGYKDSTATASEIYVKHQLNAADDSGRLPFFGIPDAVCRKLERRVTVKKSLCFILMMAFLFFESVQFIPLRDDDVFLYELFAAALFGLATAFFCLAKHFTYKKAIARIDEGDSIKAYEKLIGLYDYKDSLIKAAEIHEKYEHEKIKSAKTGDSVILGAYEQKTYTLNRRVIEWRVLAKSGDKTLLISEKALGYQACADFEKSGSLRDWLNGKFANRAFSEDEKKLIQSTAEGDQVFLLSGSEADEYFVVNNARKCAPTEYAQALGAVKAHCSRADKKTSCRWWLRSHRREPSDFSCVDSDGSIVSFNGKDAADGCFVRPAMWVSPETGGERLNP